jgi:hypothetical protein
VRVHSEGSAVSRARAVEERRAACAWRHAAEQQLLRAGRRVRVGRQASNTARDVAGAGSCPPQMPGAARRGAAAGR